MAGALSILAARAHAGPWSIEPRLGASAEYDSNPGLRQFDPQSEEHIAALFNVPLRYDTGYLQWDLTPSGRISNTRGYSSLAANYEHLDSMASLVSELGSISLQSGLARDSSLYHAGELDNGIGVRRDTAMSAIDWTHAMTARSQIQMDLSWTRVRYDQASAVTTLVDYKYLNGGPTFSYELNEHDTVKMLGSYGKYQSLSGISESKSENLQLAFVRRFTEIWSLSASAGYSHATDTQKYFFGPFFLGTLTSTQNSTVYSADLTRQGEVFNFDGGISRALQPTGQAYLSRQDSVHISDSYTRSERWDFALSATWQKVLNHYSSGADAEVRYISVQLTANWHWTPQWMLSMHAMHISQQYGQPPANDGSSGVSVDLIRQFLRTEL